MIQRKGGAGPVAAAALVLIAFGSALSGVTAAHYRLRAFPLDLQSLLRPGTVPYGDWLPQQSSSFQMPEQLQRAALDGLAAIVFAVLVAGIMISLLAYLAFTLTRFSRRRQEFATRAALGGTPVQLRAEVFGPVAREAALGALLGWASSWVLSAALWLWWPGSIAGEAWPRLQYAGLTAIGYGCGCLLISNAAIWVFVLRPTMAAALRTGERATASLAERRFRELLSTAQIAGCVVLLGVAGVLSTRPLSAASEADTEPAPLMVVRLEETAGLTALERMRSLEALLSQVRSAPGVTAETLASAGAVVGVGVRDVVYSPCDVCIYQPFQLHAPWLHAVGPGFFALTGRRVLRGREFGNQDRLGAPRVAVVGRSFAAANFGWPGNPLGREIRLQFGMGEPHRIVGVVEDVPGLALGAPPIHGLTVFLPALQYPPRSVDVVLSEQNARALPVLDGGWTWKEFSSLETVRTQARAPLDFLGYTVKLLGWVCFLLAGYGLYATTIALIEAGGRELDIRAALGATPSAIIRLLLLRGVTIAGVGTFAGGLAALAAQRLLAAILPSAAVTIESVALAAVVLAAITLAGTARPAWASARSVSL